jgi:uncharacterized paraquat-inducible protein A
MNDASHRPRRRLALAGLVLAIALLMPGLVLPVITIRGVLQPEGIAELAPKLLDQGISEQSVATLKPLINPAILPLLEAAPGGLRGALVNRLAKQLAADLKSGSEIEVYQQTRSILGSVRHLYSVGSNTAATLILIFSVLVPFVKASLVLWAVYHHDPPRRERTLRFVETIAKWSMADVFAVALFIAYLAAQATQSAGGSSSALVTFNATFGPGFYWFAAYCVFSLATQQATARWIMAARRQ